MSWRNGGKDGIVAEEYKENKMKDAEWQIQRCLHMYKQAQTCGYKSGGQNMSAISLSCNFQILIVRCVI